MKLTHSLVVVGLIGVATATAPAASATHGAGTESAAKGKIGTVYLVQALPGRSVSAKVDHAAATPLQTEAVSKPLYLSIGKHTVAFGGSGASLTTSITVKAGSSTDVVLHRPASVSGKPVVNIYHNNLKTAGADKGRVVVAHTAVVPPADIIVDGQVVFSNIANGEFASADVPAGTHVVKVVPTGEKKPVVLGPVDLPVQASVLTRVFAVGQPSNNSMSVIVQTLPLLAKGQQPPTTVPLGSAGFAAHRHVVTTKPVSTKQAARTHAARRVTAGPGTTASGIAESWYLAGGLVLAAGGALIPLVRRRRGDDAGARRA